MINGKYITLRSRSPAEAGYRDSRVNNAIFEYSLSSQGSIPITNPMFNFTSHLMWSTFTQIKNDRIAIIWLMLSIWAYNIDHIKQLSLYEGNKICFILIIPNSEASLNFPCMMAPPLVPEVTRICSPTFRVLGRNNNIMLYFPRITNLYVLPSTS